MMHSKLRERAERLGRIPAGNTSRGTDFVAVRLRPLHNRAEVRPIDATRALVRGGLALSEAKQSVDAMLRDDQVIVDVQLQPHEFLDLSAKLREAGIFADLHRRTALDASLRRA